MPPGYAHDSPRGLEHVKRVAECRIALGTGGEQSPELQWRLILGGSFSVKIVPLKRPVRKKYQSQSDKFENSLSDEEDALGCLLDNLPLLVKS